MSPTPQISFTCILLTVSGSTVRVVGQSSSTRLSEPPRLVLEVVNEHFTRGEEIRSTFLKVLSEGTIECHAIRFGWKDEKDSVKTMQVSLAELAKISSVLNDPRLRDLNDRYRLQRPFTDGWISREININRPSLPRQYVRLFFAGGSGDSVLPEALKKLGCQSLELRRKVYGDESASPILDVKMKAYYGAACTGL